MSSPESHPKKPRRVSFAAFDSPSTSTSTTKTRSSPRPNYTPKPAISNIDNHNNSSDTCPPPQTRSPPSNTCPPSQASSPDCFAGVPTHTVTNTPRGLVIDGVLQPRGPTAHSHPGGPQPQPQPFPGSYTYNPSIPPYINNTAQPYQVNMSSVGAGLMPDPYAAHYQPPVPDTTNGPFQYTYVARTDPQYMMQNGFAAGGNPGFYAPGAFPYQQAQPGMATAPIPMMAPGPQMPPMQPAYMSAPMANVPPGFMPPMNCGAVPSGPAYVATGIGHPTPPITPPSTFFPGGGYGGGYGGFEMGKTKAEIDAENQYNSLHNQMNEPQSIKPADDDISRMYWCRELDGQWVSRSRFSLDRMRNFRWYVTENGVFYAKMLPE
ncbi:hypothetical protein E0Z10_g2660 [Xylaria hypoxylon]|uniref:Uncharacterized protein n=1 Tax=Xylaria hypoxylon TaxID=37992 RepID=A0A4Z0Z3H9_9PEZI|nr:hypothetical protein E0Z10_g2660 [Xylaria hypoxylon]